MAFKIFISHSVALREPEIVYAMANEAARRKTSPFIPNHNWEPEGFTPERI